MDQQKKQSWIHAHMSDIPAAGAAAQGCGREGAGFKRRHFLRLFL